MAIETASWPELITVAETAKILRCSLMTVYRLMAREELRHRRVGRNFRIYKESLREYLGIPEEGNE